MKHHAVDLSNLRSLHPAGDKVGFKKALKAPLS